MSTDTRWTRERVEAALEGAQLTGAVNRTYVTIIDDLLADRDLLLAERDQPASTWRLPEILGGRPVAIVDENNSGEVVVRVESPDGNHGVLTIMRSWLVEVRPPSIEDPITLPVEFKAQNPAEVRLYADGASNVRLEIDAPDEGASLHARFGPTGMQVLARALWQRANAVEHGPVSGPLGSRTEQARALDERNGVVAVQPGRGSS